MPDQQAPADVVVIVTGQPVLVPIGSADTVLDVRRVAVATLGYDEGAYWEVRDRIGELVDQTRQAVEVCGTTDRLFVNLPPGVGA